MLSFLQPLVTNWPVIILVAVTSLVITLTLDYLFFKESRAIKLLRKHIYLIAILAIIYVILYFLHLQVIGNVLVLLYSAYIIDRITNLYITKFFGEILQNYELKTIFSFFARAFIWISALFMVLYVIGIDIGPLLTSLGITSIIVGLALQTTLSNAFSGMAITSEGSIKEEDVIEIPDLKILGKVEHITWRGVHLRTMYDTYVIIPFDYLSKNIVINRTRKWPWYWARLDFGVSYFEDLQKVEDKIKEILEKLGYEGKVFFQDFGNSNINLTVLVKVYSPQEELEKKSELIKTIKKEFDKAGIEISFPNRNVFIRPETLDKVLDKIFRYYEKMRKD